MMLHRKVSCWERLIIDPWPMGGVGTCTGKPREQPRALSLNPAVKGQLKQATGCVRDFLGEVEKFWDLQKFAKKTGPGFQRENLCQM